MKIVSKPAQRYKFYAVGRIIYWPCNIVKQFYELKQKKIKETKVSVLFALQLFKYLLYD